MEKFIVDMFRWILDANSTNMNVIEMKLRKIFEKSVTDIVKWWVNQLLSIEEGQPCNIAISDACSSDMQLRRFYQMKIRNSSEPSMDNRAVAEVVLGNVKHLQPSSE